MFMPLNGMFISRMKSFRCNREKKIEWDKKDQKEEVKKERKIQKENRRQHLSKKIPNITIV